ncbi:MAG: hypothetical protein RIE86_19985 [Imperialibacter sp.]|uniref:hypothetical protein n=1 Tax=Imperialibacter sp. TaxID=2038411 RepID=UPI0032F08056
MKVRGYIFTRKFLAYFLALYLLNYSIDGRDAQPDHVAEDLTHNDIESILEFALESVLGIENAMQEHDEQDGSNGHFSTHHVVYCQQPTPVPTVLSSDFVIVVHTFRNPSLHIPQNFLEISSPPPKARA